MARTPPRSSDIRFKVEPGDVPLDKIARRLHLTEAQFRDCAPRLYSRGFPLPDPDTGMYDLEAVDRWRHRRHAVLFPELGTVAAVPEPQAPKKSLGAMFREGQETRRNSRTA